MSLTYGMIVDRLSDLVAEISEYNLDNNRSQYSHRCKACGRKYADYYQLVIEAGWLKDDNEITVAQIWRKNGDDMTLLTEVRAEYGRSAVKAFAIDELSE